MKGKSTLIFMLFFINLFAETTNLSEKFQMIPVGKEKEALFCRSFGTGSPLLILHGGPGFSHDYLLPEFKRLAKDHLVIFYDQRGCGKSMKAWSSKENLLDLYLTDIEAIQDHFGFKKVSILGHSWGGFLAMHYALCHPERIDRLILSNSMPACHEEFLITFKERKAKLKPYEEELQHILTSKALEEGDPKMGEALYRLYARVYCYDSEKVNLINFKMTPEAFVNGRKINQLFFHTDTLKDYNLYPRLKQIHIKTLVVHGDTDIVPPWMAKKLHDHLPNSEYILLEKCGHFPFVEDPENYFRHLKNFLK